MREHSTVGIILIVFMKTAKRNGVLQTLAPGVFKYKDNRSKLVDDLLQNYKVKPKR